MGHHQAHGLWWAKAQPGPAHGPIKARGPAWPMASIGRGLSESAEIARPELDPGNPSYSDPT